MYFWEFCAKPRLYIRPIRLKLHGETQDRFGNDEISIFINKQSLNKVSVQDNADYNLNACNVYEVPRCKTGIDFMLKERDIVFNDDSTKTTVSPEQVNSWHKLLWAMETSSSPNKVTKFEVSYTFGIKEVNLGTLLTQQYPGSFLVGMVLDQLCINAIDIALAAVGPGGKVASRIGKSAAQHAYKQGLKKAASRLETLSTELGKEATQQTGKDVISAIGEFLDMTEFCVLDLAGQVGGDAMYEVTYEVSRWRPENCDGLANGLRRVASLMSSAVLLLSFRSLQ